MRNIKYIVLHCTATPQSTNIASIQRYWSKVLKWKSPGYHYIIEPNGEINNLLDIEKVANGVAGYNRESIHISYIGGIDDSKSILQKRLPIDNRTPEQIESMIFLIKWFALKYPNAKICGHRDFPGVNKACPSFDVAKWLSEIKLSNDF